MRRIIFIGWLLLLICMPAFAGDNKETLTLKRNLAVERVMRLKAEIELMKIQYRDAQELLKLSNFELEGLNTSLNALEPPPDKNTKKK
ncbi:MAG: hypothetical protein UY48_C0010G0015 [Candidatus Gottesmanbacteria bacterium GW2011_GWB1_49_7]|uniref:Uncharacterized protein n=1 Tax=Candidatus Gottesmanbacteria bacterium GW2011_GWB1_49_7 TaxID=1618448 RepID=A0A0G1W1T6_9BACT|nr:MAG: hypothetical protein UY48_C0010G0015 [Candidatus Gottesmanbacteria bacterium GW2011_GWB1_49_7]